MIQLNITGRNYQLNDKVVTYVNEKIGALDKYLPRQAKPAMGTVMLEEDASGREDNHYVCEAVIKVPGPDLAAKEATLNIYAAIDIVEAKLKAQIIKYKEKHHPKYRGRQWLTKVLRREREPGL